MRWNGRLAAAFLASLAAHALLLLWLEPPTSPAAPAATLEIELIATAVPPVAPESPETPQIEPDPSAQIEPEKRPEAEAAGDSRPRLEAPASRPPARPAPFVLNLDRPSNWEALVAAPESAEPVPGLDFNATLRAEVAARQRERERLALLAVRTRAVYGVPDEAYRRQGAQGELVKVDGRCYALKDTPELGSEPRWWMERCLDARRSSWELPPFEVDARARAFSAP